MNQNKSKKRRHQQYLQEGTGSLESSPSAHRGQRNRSYSTATPFGHKIVFPDTSFPATDQMYHQRDTSTRLSDQQFNSRIPFSVAVQARPNGHGDNSKASNTLKDDAHVLQNEKSSRGQHSRKSSRPTHIIPPSDPKDTPSFLDAVRAQNRRRRTQHQTFVADVGSEPESQEDQTIQALHHNAPATTQDAEIPESVNSGARDSSSSSSSDSDSDSDSSSEGETDSDLDIGRQGKRHARSGEKRLNKAKAPTKPAVMGRELIEQMQRKKERIENAAQNAITKLTGTKPNTNLKTAKKPPPAQAPSTLTATDQSLLQALHALVPPQILEATRTKLLSQSQSQSHPHQDNKPNNKQNHHPPPNPNPNPTYIPPTSLTLSASTHLILHLSGQALHPTTVTTAAASTPTLILQTELTRIAASRGDEITALRGQVERLQAQCRAREGEGEGQIGGTT